MAELLLLAFDQFEFFAVVFGALQQVVLRLPDGACHGMQTCRNKIIVGRHAEILSGTPRPAPGTSPDTGRSKGTIGGLSTRPEVSKWGGHVRPCFVVSRQSRFQAMINWLRVSRYFAFIASQTAISHGTSCLLSQRMRPLVSISTNRMLSGEMR